MRRLLVLSAILSGCGVPPPADGHFDDVEFERAPDPTSEYETLEQAVVSCALSQSTGYRQGNAFPVTLVSVDGQPVEVTTANAFAVMQAAAASQGVGIRINDGFRTPEQQAYYRSCYVNCNCNSCNEAAAVGWSNHQSGLALDLNTSSGGVLNWLNNNGRAYGFARTVASEPWHWERVGTGPGGGPCNPNPPPPVPCDSAWGPLSFSCDGPVSGARCVNVNEPADPHTWNDNYFCSGALDIGLRWSALGRIPGLECTNTPEGAEVNPGNWADNFICTDTQSPYTFAWSSAGPIAGQNCVQWGEPADPNSWHDNFLCASQRSSFTNAGFTFSSAGRPASGHCISVNEPADPDTWSDNYFCSDADYGMKWAGAGPIAGMVCTRVSEGSEALATIWADNYLCVPPDAQVRFTWSSAGKIPGKQCVRWFDHAEAYSNTWWDNFLCIDTFSTWLPTEAAPVSESTEVFYEVPPAPVAPEENAAAPQLGGAEVTEMRLESRGCSTSVGLLTSLGVLLLIRRKPRQQ